MCFNTLSSRNKAILSCLSDRPRPAWRSCEAPRLESFSKGKSPCLENWEALALFVRRRTKSLISLIMLKSTTWRLTWRSVLQTFLTSWRVSCCLKNLRQALLDGPGPETLFIIFNEWLVLFFLGKVRPDVTGVNWHPPVQRPIFRTLVARCHVMVDKQRPRLCGPTENCLVEALLKRVLQWLRSRCRCPFCRWCPCPLLGQTKMFCIYQFHRQRWQIGKSNLITPNLNYFLNV